MKKITGWMTTLAFALALPTIASVAVAAPAKANKAGDKTAAAEGSTGTAAGGMSKEEADKLKEHNKLRGQIAKVKYPATKSEIISKVKGVKADDKKWVEQTLPEKSYTSADDVYQALGWPTGEAAPSPAAAK